MFRTIVDHVDLFLYDLKIVDDERHREFTGVSNQPILDNLRTLVEKRKKAVIRFPLIPQITDTDSARRDAHLTDQKVTLTRAPIANALSI